MKKIDAYTDEKYAIHLLTSLEDLNDSVVRGKPLSRMATFEVELSHSEDEDMETLELGKGYDLIIFLIINIGLWISHLFCLLSI